MFIIADQEKISIGNSRKLYPLQSFWYCETREKKLKPTKTETFFAIWKTVTYVTYLVVFFIAEN